MVKIPTPSTSQFPYLPGEDYSPRIRAHLGPPLVQYTPQLNLPTQVTSNAGVWKLYSDLYKDGESEEEKDKVYFFLAVLLFVIVKLLYFVFVKFLQFLVKANGVNIQSPGWEKTQEKIENVVKITLELSRGLKFELLTGSTLAVIHSSFSNLVCGMALKLYF